MANREDRELELALALSANEERERQERLRGSDPSKQRQPYQPLRSSPYQVTGRPYAPSEAHQAHHMRNLTMSDPNAPPPSESNITPIYVPAPPAAQVAPFYATTLYNPFVPPPYSGTTASPIAQWQPPPSHFYPNYSGAPPPQYAQQPPPAAYPPPPGYSPAPPPIDAFKPPPRVQTQLPSTNAQTPGAVPMPPPAVAQPMPYVQQPVPQRAPQATLAPPPAGLSLRVSSPSSPADSPASLHALGASAHQVAPLSALLPPSSPGVARAPSPSRPKPLMRETTTLEMALTVTNSLGLIRVPVPGDGACLFRAVSERLFGTQRRHRFVRRACVHYMERHAEDFRVFIEGSGYKFGDYIEMMQQETSWGGQIELQAMSMVFSVDFAIYSAKHDPVFVENGFRRYVALWFSHGSHYDVLYPMPEFSKITVAQELVFWLVERTFNPNLPFKPSFNYKYRNIEMERYEAHVRRREEKDHNLAAQLMSDEKKIDYLRVQQGGDHDVARRMQEEEEDARLARALQVSLGAAAEPTVIRGEHHHSGKKDKKTSPRSPRGEKHGFLDRIKEILPGGHSDKDRRAKSPSGRDDLRSGGFH